MKATEFCEFFEFSLFKETGETEDGELYNYYATDNQGTFQTRYIESVGDLVNCFDSLLEDYINNDVEMNGFEYDEGLPKSSYYEQLYHWMDDTEDYRGSWTMEIVGCLVNPMLIEDDLREEEN